MIEAGIYRALVVSTAPTDQPPPTEAQILARSREIATLTTCTRPRRAHASAPRAGGHRCRDRQGTRTLPGSGRRSRPGAATREGDAETLAGLEVEVVAGAAHPTVHARGLPRNPQFAAAIRAHIAAQP